MDSIVLFDGVCNFCNAAVNFIIEHDPGKRFKFAALQSDLGVELKAKYGIGDDIDSVILIEDGHAYTRTTAALRIASHLSGVWRAAYVFMIVPASVRDIFYKLFASYRYRLFGRREACMMPSPDVRERFVS